MLHRARDAIRIFEPGPVSNIITFTFESDPDSQCRPTGATQMGSWALGFLQMKG